MHCAIHQTTIAIWRLLFFSYCYVSDFDIAATAMYPIDNPSWKFISCSALIQCGFWSTSMVMWLACGSAWGQHSMQLQIDWSNLHPYWLYPSSFTIKIDWSHLHLDWLESISWKRVLKTSAQRMTHHRGGNSMHEKQGKYKEDEHSLNGLKMETQRGIVANGISTRLTEARPVPLPQQPPRAGPHYLWLKLALHHCHQRGTGRQRVGGVAGDRMEPCVSAFLY
jgi:hypothetical protein